MHPLPILSTMVTSTPGEEKHGNMRGLFGDVRACVCVCVPDLMYIRNVTV